MKGTMSCGNRLMLSEVETGKKVQIVKVEGNNGLKRRILDMGLVPGTIVSMERKAPLNDPVAIWFRGYELSLRLSEAESVIVKPMSCAGCTGCGGGK
jgi:ferrous iron transport protein A